jgi:hypothetical protein
MRHVPLFPASFNVCAGLRVEGYLSDCWWPGEVVEQHLKKGLRLAFDDGERGGGRGCGLNKGVPKKRSSGAGKRGTEKGREGRAASCAVGRACAGLLTFVVVTHPSTPPPHTIGLLTYSGARFDPLGKFLGSPERTHLQAKEHT